ncbi:MAG: hypothetical protein KAK04_08200, partial [Cyclobacteriaceae bacterium]|nr:hypothetical protein [Cyclobacteriaceae bacterium]
MKKHHFLNLLIIVLVSLFTCQDLHSAAKVAGIFSDNMVLQRGVNAPIWGTANPGEKIVVEIHGLVS